MGDRTILVTGGSSGVGLSMVHHLQRRYDVVVMARRIERMKDEFRRYRNVASYKVDLSDPSSLADALTLVSREHGQVPYIINNAGIMEKGSVAKIRSSQFARSFAINVFAPLQIMQWGLHHMKEQQFGRIVNLTSGAPLNCSAQFSAYSSSKAALNALTVTAARECASGNIRINLMSPGPVKTEMAPHATLPPSMCNSTLDFLLNDDANCPSGGFFWLGHQLPLVPDLTGVDWASGSVTEGFQRIISTKT